MADYISREAAIEKITALINKSGRYTAYESGADDACYIVEHEVPPADVRPVVRGKWLPYEFGDYHWHKCSVCGVPDKFIETVYRKGFIDTELFSARNFCPHCGADMRGDHGNGNKT